MPDQLTATNPDQSMLSRKVNRRHFLKGAASQVVRHSLITAPTVALMLSATAIPARAQFSYAVSDATRVALRPDEPGFLDRLIRYLRCITARRNPNLDFPGRDEPTCPLG